MKDLFKALFTSKKFVSSLVSMLCIVFQHFGLNIPIDIALGVVSPLMLYVVGQTAVDVTKIKNGSK